LSIGFLYGYLHGHINKTTDKLAGCDCEYL